MKKSKLAGPERPSMLSGTDTRIMSDSNASTSIRCQLVISYLRRHSIRAKEREMRRFLNKSVIRMWY